MEKPSRENRLTNLLKEPSTQMEDGWYMCVPPCFNDALDIKQTDRIVDKKKTLVWTQGSSFNFKEGDSIYDTPNAYNVWSEALKFIGLCIKVRAGLSAGSSEGNASRSAGLVAFTVLTPNQDRTGLVEREEHSMSQDEFVRLLICGLSEELKGTVNNP